MTDKKILDVFYNKLVLEAQAGQIYCYFTMNIIFNLEINNTKITSNANVPYEGLVIPTLKINDKAQFDELLVSYVLKAYNFYNKNNFEFIDKEVEEEFKEEYLIKYIICTLLANATMTDFENPLAFLRSRIALFDNKLISGDNEVLLGTIPSIDAKLYVEEEQSPINAETPYSLHGSLKFSDGYILELPNVYAGNDGEKYHIYAVQMPSSKYVEDESSYLKQIRQGYIAKLNGAPEHYFLAVMVFLGFCNDQEIEVKPFLIERWNAKRIASYKMMSKNYGISLAEMENKQEKIQHNLTDILIRYFTKIMDVSDGLDCISIPFEEDDIFRIVMNSNFTSRCVAFNELVELINEYKKQNKNTTSLK